MPAPPDTGPYSDIMFSVVIPLFNKRDLIGETIKGVLAQSYTAFELVVVNDGSTDGSDDVVAAFADPRIRLVQQQNQGAAAARNTGWSAARNPFVAFLDGDDQWDADYLATVAALVRDFPDCGAYGMGYRRRLSDDKKVGNRLETSLQRSGRNVIPDYFLAATCGDQPFYTSSVCIRREVIAYLNGFQTGITHGEDLDLWARIALEFLIAFDPVEKVTYRLDASNRAMNKRPPLGWVFRRSLEAFKLKNPTLHVSNYLDQCVEHIELYHASLNLGKISGRHIRAAMGNISWERYPTRKLKIMIATFIPSALSNRVMAWSRR